jgi:vesicle coat complex subunit
VPHLRELLNDNDPSVCAEALVALERGQGRAARGTEISLG